jgi:hypothetical protein
MSVPYLSIDKNENNENVIIVDANGAEKSFSLSNEGAVEVGKHLKSVGAWHWLQSSSLDFPGEYDEAFSADSLFELINEGFNQ